jgi:hypothetical protein
MALEIPVQGHRGEHQREADDRQLPAEHQGEHRGAEQVQIEAGLDAGLHAPDSTSGTVPSHT